MSIKPCLKLLFLFFVLFSVCVACVFVGSTNILHLDSSTAKKIVFLLRVPRLFAAFMSGVSLSLAGFLIQVAIQNPLGSPNVLGLNSGSLFFVVLASIFLPNAVLFFPLFAFLGAVFSLLLVLGLSKKVSFFRGESPVIIVLSGVCVNIFLASALDFVTIIKPDCTFAKLIFRLGSLSVLNTDILFFSCFCIVFCVFFVLLYLKQIEILSLGAFNAFSLGLDVTKARVFILCLSCVLAGCATSFAGICGFTGLVTPHIARLLFQGKIKYQIISSMLLGAILVIFCDTLGRVLFLPHEVPVGILLSFVGVPFFVVLLRQKKAKSV